MLELQKKQRVLFVANIEKSQEELGSQYKKETILKDGTSKFDKTRYSDQSERIT
jgi:hypothetical protein